MLARRKKVCKHANPLFEKWLLEWAEQAANKNSNMKFNFQRAASSLRRYPLPLYSGKDCLLLAHFGDKICKLIDKKLEEYNEENGPINWDSYIKFSDLNDKKKTSRKKRAPSKINVILPKIPGEIDCIENGNRQYIPVFRSGAYALLLALHRASKKENYSGFLLKSELIDSAKMFCDASFITPPMGTHYTAWSSMSTLINKKLVCKEGNPARYQLTEIGEYMADKLEKLKDSPCELPNTTNIWRKSNKKSVKATVVATSTKESHNISSSDSDDDVPDFSLKQIPTYTTDSSQLLLTSSWSHNDEIYLCDDDKNNEIATKPLSHLKESNENDKDFQLNCYKEPSPIIFKDTNLTASSYVKNIPMEEISLIDSSEDEDQAIFKLKNLPKSTVDNKEELIFTFIDTIGNETTFKDNAFVKIDEIKGMLQFLIKCKISDLKPPLEFEYDNTRTAPPGYTYAFLNDVCTPNVSTLSYCDKVSPSNAPILNLSTKYRINELTSDAPSWGENTVSIVDNLQGLHHLPKKVKKLVSSDSQLAVNSNANLPNFQPEEKTVTYELNPKKKFSLFPNQFKIILCVDNMEVTGGFSSNKKGSKDIIINELKQNGVDFDVRNLSIGDFLWICQEKYPTGNKFREVVLPFVVERKRMDDLASSIRDGRFREQKFRLKKSGLGRLVYLVEEIGSNHLSIPLSTCEQASTNTQILDGFAVKVTADQKESAAYLTVMTKYLAEKFKNTIIDCIEIENLSGSRQTINSKNLFGPLFEDLNAFSLKNQTLSVQDMFAKHLLQLFGNSLEKVTAIIEKYPTPNFLREAIEKSSLNEGEDILSSIKCKNSGRPVGSAISSQLTRLYSSKDLS